MLLQNERMNIFIDPYLTDSLSAEGRMRSFCVDEGVYDIKPDVILITHAHPDHFDIETLRRLILGGKDVTVLTGSADCCCELSALRGNVNCVLLSPHSVWSEGGVTFYSVKAAHTDPSAIGFIVDDGDKTYYISGDTLYNFDVIDDCLDLVEDGVDYAFLPINGRYSNMNAKDAADFAYEIGAKCAIPVHYGLFDNVDPEEFDFDDRMIVSPFESCEL